MNTLKHLTSWLSLYLVTTLFFLTAITFAFFTTINAGSIKETLHDQNIYDKLVPTVLSTAHYGNDTSGNSAGELPLNEPWVKDAVKKAFPDADLEQKGNAVIDGTFTWLEGDTTKPEFRLDFTANKQSLGDEIGNYSKTRLASLPGCTSLSQIPASIDAYRITCLPPGVNPDTVAATLSSDIKTGEGFLNDPVITSDNLSSSAKSDEVTNTSVGPVSKDGIGNAEKDVFAQLEPARNAYKHRGLIMWLLPVLTVLTAAAGVFLASDRNKGIKWLYRSLFASAIGLIVFYLLFKFGLEEAYKTLQNDAISKEIIAPVFTDLIQKTEKIYLIFAAIAAVAGATLLVVNKKLVPRAKI